LRKLTRPEAPDCLHSNAVKWTDDYIKNRANDPKYKFNWRDNACYQAIRNALTHITQQHCAFCDGPIGSESRETVEHFKPKSQFPELAFAWDNLFPCCDLCQSIKLEQFDEALLKPDALEYIFHDYFTVNYHTGEIEPSHHADATAQHRAKITLSMYGLNVPKRKTMRLREWRFYSNESNPHIDDFNYRFFLE